MQTIIQTIQNAIPFPRSQAQDKSRAQARARARARRAALATSATRVAALASVLSLSLFAWFVSHVHGLTLAYNDAMSHLNVARLVFDNIQPGMAQLGTVWLPMSHLLSLPLVWVDAAWQSGVAGSIVSMAAYVASVYGIYHLVRQVGGSKLGAVVGAAAVALNLNLLYLQSTPLTEPLFLAEVILSALCLVRFFKTDDAKYLLALGALGFMQVLTRYDGWFVVAVQALLIAVQQLHHHRRGIAETIGRLMLYAVPVAFAVLVWVGWNLVIFGDPLYFALGEYSAQAQQVAIDSSDGLYAKGKPLAAAEVFGYTVLSNIGAFVAMLSLVGYSAYLMLNRFSEYSRLKMLTMAALVSPIIFNILSLYLGFSTINTPEIGHNPSGEPSNYWFNVRYGIMALPLAAVGAGLFASIRKPLAAVAMTVIIAQGVITYQTGIISVTDTTRGLSTFVNRDIAIHLRDNVKPDEQVLMSMAAFGPVAFESGLPLKQFVHEGVHGVWQEAIERPAGHAEWIVVDRNGTVNAVAGSIEDNQYFKSEYELSHQGEHASVYRLKDSATASR